MVNKKKNTSIENCTHYTYIDLSIGKNVLSTGCTVFLKRISLVQLDSYPESDLLYYDRSYTRQFYFRSIDKVETLTTPIRMEIYVIGPIFQYGEQLPDVEKYTCLI
jgi:hypothetical protein